jgi:hypothetical protein
MDTMMTITACIHQLTNLRSQLKDVLRDAKSNGSFCEVEVATARVERKFLHLTDDKPVYAIEREEKIEMDIKARQNRWNTQGSFWKPRRQIRGHVKPNSTNKYSLTRVTVPDNGPEGSWKHIIGKEDLEDHLIERNIEKFLTTAPHNSAIRTLVKNLVTQVIHKWLNQSLKGHSNTLL